MSLLPPPGEEEDTAARRMQHKVIVKNVSSLSLPLANNQPTSLARLITAS